VPNKLHDTSKSIRVSSDS